MTEKRFTHNCFKCKYSKWEYHEEVPIVDYLYCKLGHKQTSYNTPFTEDFVCKDYKHSYFMMVYFGYWLWAIIVIAFIISVLGALGVI